MDIIVDINKVANQLDHLWNNPVTPEYPHGDKLFELLEIPAQQKLLSHIFFRLCLVILDSHVDIFTAVANEEDLTDSILGSTDTRDQAIEEEFQSICEYTNNLPDSLKIQLLTYLVKYFSNQIYLDPNAFRKLKSHKKEVAEKILESLSINITENNVTKVTNLLGSNFLSQSYGSEYAEEYRKLITDNLYESNFYIHLERALKTQKQFIAASEPVLSKFSSIDEYRKAYERYKMAQKEFVLTQMLLSVLEEFIAIYSLNCLTESYEVHDISMLETLGIEDEVLSDLHSFLIDMKRKMHEIHNPSIFINSKLYQTAKLAAARFINSDESIHFLMHLYSNSLNEFNYSITIEGLKKSLVATENNSADGSNSQLYVGLTQVLQHSSLYSKELAIEFLTAFTREDISRIIDDNFNISPETMDQLTRNQEYDLLSLLQIFFYKEILPPDAVTTFLNRFSQSNGLFTRLPWTSKNTKFFETF